MGKSTTAQMFADAGVPVHDADATVHALYRAEAVDPVGELFPNVVVDGAIDRQALAKEILGDPEAMKRLTDIVHPLVRKKEQEFLAKARETGQRIVVLDIPLLFETDGEKRVDVRVVVTARAEIQKQRVLSRPNMSVSRFNEILQKQMPDRDKRLRAHFLIDTGYGLDFARRSVASILKALSGSA